MGDSTPRLCHVFCSSPPLAYVDYLGCFPLFSGERPCGTFRELQSKGFAHVDAYGTSVRIRVANAAQCDTACMVHSVKLQHLSQRYLQLVRDSVICFINTVDARHSRDEDYRWPILRKNVPKWFFHLLNLIFIGKMSPKLRLHSAHLVSKSNHTELGPVRGCTTCIRGCQTTSYLARNIRLRTLYHWALDKRDRVHRGQPAPILPQIQSHRRDRQERVDRS